MDSKSGKNVIFNLLYSGFFLNNYILLKNNEEMEEETYCEYQQKQRRRGERARESIDSSPL